MKLSFVSKLLGRPDPATLAPPRLLRAIGDALALEPRVLPWAWRVPESQPQWILTHFVSPGLSRYQGKEVVLLDAERLYYYRLPGAKPAGEGEVKDGRYAVELERPGSTPLPLTVERQGAHDVRVLSFDATPGSRTPLEHHPVRLPYAAELEDVLALWCESLEAALRLGSFPAPESAASFLRGLSTRLGPTGHRLGFALAALSRTLSR